MSDKAWQGRHFAASKLCYKLHLSHEPRFLCRGAKGAPKNPNLALFSVDDERTSANDLRLSTFGGGCRFGSIVRGLAAAWQLCHERVSLAPQQCYSATSSSTPTLTTHHLQICSRRSSYCIYISKWQIVITVNTNKMSQLLDKKPGIQRGAWLVTYSHLL
jgi:hypothetical protein